MLLLLICGGGSREYFCIYIGLPKRKRIEVVVSSSLFLCICVREHPYNDDVILLEPIPSSKTDILCVSLCVRAYAYSAVRGT